jgi:Na+-transporting methylmalonyl-CoA/oxaloacetate decarboxylase gamma subunit
MFCPSCGTESTGLNYCNRCGANLTVPIASSVEAVPPINLTKPMLIVGSVALLITLGGFFMILEAATVLATRTGAGGDLPMMIVFFGMLTVLTLDILLMRQLSKLVSAALAPERRAKEKQTPSPQNTFQLPQPTTARLEPGVSVTENTTRFFDNYPSAALPEPVPVKKTDQ